MALCHDCAVDSSAQTMHDGVFVRLSRLAAPSNLIVVFDRLITAAFCEKLR